MPQTSLTTAPGTRPPRERGMAASRAPVTKPEMTVVARLPNHLGFAPGGPAGDSRTVLAGASQAGRSVGGVVADTEVPYQALYRRFRPQRFAEVLGQGHVTRALQAAVRDGKVAHAYLFSGPRGTGKTSTARILAMALNCEQPEDGEPCGRCGSCSAIRAGASLDVQELDSATNRGIDEMRDLLSRVALGTPGRWKVYIVDEVHQITSAAASALLKTLEEPPAHVIFVLATTDPQKVLDTIRSRTQHFEFRLLGSEVLADLLTQVAGRADIELSSEALDVVVRRGHGSARDALSALDQVAAAGTVEDDSGLMSDVVDAIIGQEAGSVLVKVAEAATSGLDPRRLGTELLEYLRNGFLATQAPELVLLSDSARDAVRQQADLMGPAALVRAMDLIGGALIDMRDSADARTTLEVALIRLAAPTMDDSRAALVERIERLERALASGAVPGAPAASRPSPGEESPAPAGPAGALPSPRPSPTPRPSQSPGPSSPTVETGSVPPTRPPGRPAAAPARPGRGGGGNADSNRGSGPPPSLGAAPPMPGRPPSPPPPPQVASPGSAPTGAAAQPESPPPLTAARGASSAAPPRPPAVAAGLPAARPEPIAESEGSPLASAPTREASPGPSSSVRRPDPTSPSGVQPASGLPAPPAPAPGAAERRGPSGSGGHLGDASSALPSREELTVAWGDQILPSLRPGVKVYVATGRFLAAEGDHAVYAVPDRGLLTRAEANRAEVEEALTGHFRRPIRMRLVLDPDAAPVGGSGAGPGRPDAGRPDADAASGGLPVGDVVPPGGADWSSGGPEEEIYDWEELEEAPGAVSSPEQRLLQAFPGAEEVEL